MRPSPPQVAARQGSARKNLHMAVVAPAPGTRSLNSPEIQCHVHRLRAVDNRTNWYYLVREYLVLGLVLGLTIAFYQYRAAWGLGWAWNVPVTLLAVAVVGGSQHRLATLGHEAAHYSLFRHRLLNEL